LILCDSGPLIAAVNKTDPEHVRCLKFVEENWDRLLVPSLAVTEVCNLLENRKRGGSALLAVKFVTSIVQKELQLIEITPDDYMRVAGLMRTYASMGLEVVDASVVALAERFNLKAVATLDRRDFCVIWPSHLPKGDRLELLP
jgi:predicted nucleic acid-binding protein